MQLQDKTQFRYTPDPGVVPAGESVFCGVCAAKMDEKRNCYGSRSFAMAMSGKTEPHDLFTCPHEEEAWHQQVVALRQEVLATPSAKIALMLELELNEILYTKRATKKVGAP